MNMRDEIVKRIDKYWCLNFDKTLDAIESFIRKVEDEAIERAANKVSEHKCNWETGCLDEDYEGNEVHCGCQGAIAEELRQLKRGSK